VADPGWFAVLAGPRLALIKLLRAHASADELMLRIKGHLADQAAPELANIRLVRSAADFDPRILAFATAFLEYVFSA
jgi:hypothetical protein